MKPTDLRPVDEAADEIELLQQQLEFAEFEWNRAIEAMQERDTRIEALEKECFALAANQCNYGFGDEFGHFRCTRIETLAAALQLIADGYDDQDINHLDYRVMVYQVARLALAPELDK